jgi:hypothetical protein
MILRPESSSGALLPPAAKGVRRALLPTVTALVLVLAPAASAAFSPLLSASSDARGVTVAYSQPASNDGPATLALYAPSTYVTTLPTATGAVVGTAIGIAVAGDIRGSTVPLDGTIRVASPAAPLAAGSTGSVGDAAKACGGTGVPAAYWILTLQGFKQTIPLAISVQKVTSGPMAGSTALVMCPPPADLPTGTAGRAQLGLKLVHLTLRFGSVFTVPDGTHTWHLRATPYTPGTGVANPAAAAEAEAQHGLPQELTHVAKPGTAYRADVSGRLTLNGAGIGGQTVRILEGARQLGTAKTNAAGDFAAAVLPHSTHAVLTAQAVVPALYHSPCTKPAFAPLPCATSIRAGFSATGHARVE